MNLYLDITNLYNAKDVSPANLDVVRDGNGSPIVANPTAPDNEKRYQLQLLKSNGSRILPTIGLVIEY